MGGGPLSKQRSEAGRLGRRAGLGWLVTCGLGGWALFGSGSFLLALFGGGFASWLTWKWFRYRGEWGMRF